MLAPAMAAPKSKKPTKAPAERKKSKLTQIGEEAQRKALLAELRRQSWNLSATAEALELGGAGNVIRAIKALDLVEQYEAARNRGDVKPGSRAVSD